MKTAIWLYFFIFIAFFDLHAQYPILTPFAISIGAAPSFIGLIMGMYSITHIPGNLLAGYGVDRIGSKYFIAFSLIIAGILLLLQSYVYEPWQLLVIRSISGFILAFLSPACLALLSKIARSHAEQSKYMSYNGIVHTAASILSPAAGALLVAKIGFNLAFLFLGWILIITGVLALFFLFEKKNASLPKLEAPESPIQHNIQVQDSIPWAFFTLPIALSCSQGILFFEIPLIQDLPNAILSTGIMFSVISIGSLITLSAMFLNRYSPVYRVAAGALLLAFCFFILAIHWPLPLLVTLFIIGMAKGIIYPALATYLAFITPSTRYGRTFALLSIAYSLGAFIGPVLAGKVRDVWSPYIFAFAFLMAALAFMPSNHKPETSKSLPAGKELPIE